MKREEPPTTPRATPANRDRASNEESATVREPAEVRIARERRHLSHKISSPTAPRPIDTRSIAAVAISFRLRAPPLCFGIGKGFPHSSPLRAAGSSLSAALTSRNSLISCRQPRFDACDDH